MTASGTPSLTTDARRTVGILLFPEVEVLDFAGPFEVFSRTRLEPGIESRRSDDSAPFTVFTVARDAGPIAATGGMQLLPDCTMEDAQGIDILVVPGGFGTRPLLEDEEMLGWVASTSSKAHLTVSVCSGALVLAKAGVLHGRRATTHWGALDLLASLDPTIMVERHARVVDDGVVTSAGVSAGIDMALCVVAKFHGDGVARETAHYIEYPWHAPEVAATASET